MTVRGIFFGAGLTVMNSRLLDEFFDALDDSFVCGLHWKLEVHPPSSREGDLHETFIHHAHKSKTKLI